MKLKAWLMEVLLRLRHNVINNNGFTLLELMIVLAIFSMILFMTLPSFHGYLLKRQLDATAVELASDIRYLQQLALAEESGSYRITFSPHSSYNTSDTYYMIKNMKVIKRVHMPPGLKLSSTSFTDNTLIINAKGMPMYGQGGTVNLHDEHNKIYKYVIVATITGRVRVSENGPIKPWGYVQ